jgi:hypothetical protein
MPYWFHGTEEKNVNSILKKGFRANSFFAKHLEEAMGLGCSEVMFWVWFDEHPTDYWEWVSRKPIGPEYIRAVVKMKPEVLYENEELELKLSRKFHDEENPEMAFCKNCEGRGQMEKAPFFRKHNQDITVCPICGGFGCVKPNGKILNEE